MVKQLFPLTMSVYEPDYKITDGIFKKCRSCY